MPVEPSLETTIDLVDRSRTGDAAARNRLIQRYLPLLTRRNRFHHLKPISHPS